MKKLLSMLGAIGLVATSSATVVSCGPMVKMNLFVFNGDKATLKIYGDPATLPESQEILDAFNEKNNLTLDLITDVIITTPVETSTKDTYTATIKATMQSKIVISRAVVTITIVTPIDLTTLTEDKTDVSWIVIDDVTILPTPQLILNAFNEKNNSALQLTTDVTVDDIKAKILPDPWGNTLTAADFRATINAVATSRAVLGSAYIKILVNLQKNDLSQIKGEGLKLRIITDDITKKPQSSYILDYFKTKNKLNPDIVWGGDIDLDHYEWIDTKPTEYDYKVTFRAVENSKRVVGVADAIVIVTAS